MVPRDFLTKRISNDGPMGFFNSLSLIKHGLGGTTTINLFFYLKILMEESHDRDVCPEHEGMHV